MQCNVIQKFTSCQVVHLWMFETKKNNQPTKKKTSSKPVTNIRNTYLKFLITLRA